MTDQSPNDQFHASSLMQRWIAAVLPDFAIWVPCLDISNTGRACHGHVRVHNSWARPPIPTDRTKKKLLAPRVVPGKELPNREPWIAHTCCEPTHPTGLVPRLVKE